MKKVISLILALTVIFSLAATCYADAAGSDWSGKNVSTVNPMLNRPSLLGTSAPTASYNCHTNGMYSFHGSAQWSTLWLEKYVYGCLKYGVYVDNKSDKPLTFIVRGVSGGDRQYTLPAYTDTAEAVGGLFFNMATRTTLFCISFNAPSNFAGYVGCAD